MRPAGALGALVGMLALAGCSAPDVTLPPSSGGLDYQLGGAYDPAADVTVVVRDSTAAPAAGVYSVCYVNGFQTQPDESAAWLPEHADLVLHDGGAPVTDPAWPEEYVLDTRTQATRDGILAVVGETITRCADAGYDAVELDNLDTWLRFDALTEEGNLALATAYADLAHDLGLAVGQKNAAEATATAREIFDFAVAEECFAYDECTAYTDAYGDHVLQVEYPDTLEVDLTVVCGSADRAPLVVLRDRELVPAGVAGHVEERC